MHTHLLRHLLPLSLALATLVQGNGADSPTIGPAKKEDGFLIHTVESNQQDRPTILRVLLPTNLERNRRYPVVYVLPVEAGVENRYGDGLLEVRKRGLHDKYNLICVMPTFARLPWYADHPTNARIRQESYLLEVVVPYIDRTYPTQARASARHLLGFSKSGWGAIALLLRHPGTFGKAVAWDAPLDMDAPGKYGSGEIFGNRENFARYRVTTLIEEKGKQLGEAERLALLGHGNFRESHRVVHDLLVKRKVPHAFSDGPRRKHDWHSGWVDEAVRFLAEAK